MNSQIYFYMLIAIIIEALLQEIINFIVTCWIYFFCHKENYLQDSFLWDTLGLFWRNTKNLTKPLKKYIIVVSKLPNKSKSWTYGSNKSQIFGIVNDQLQSRYLNRFISSSTLPNFTSNVAVFWKRSAESWKCDWGNG